MAPSGKGKTTLLNILLGLEPYDKGRIRGLEGRKKSAVFQEDRLCENLSSRANIRMIRERKISGCREFSKKMEEGLEALELKEWGNQPVRELSGGMKRRTAILRALLADWEILFMDEPFKGLDIETKKKVMEYVRKSVMEKQWFLLPMTRKRQKKWERRSGSVDQDSRSHIMYGKND